MASLLRTFANNPGLGNFSDTICQIIKELVDNAIDSRPDRVRIILNQQNEHLEISVNDNGCGIEDIQEAVHPFNTSKEDSETSGRYGIGLTLCLLHAQRLAPGTWAWIQSGISNTNHWTRVKCVVDVNNNTVDCINTKEIQKLPSQHGTSVRVTVPVQDTTWWPRAHTYLRRLYLVELPCHIEVQAPSWLDEPLRIPETVSIDKYLDGNIRAHAHSTVSIRAEGIGKDQLPKMRVDLIFHGEDSIDDRGTAEESHESEQTNAIDVEFVRIVNCAPLLDTNESCGLYSDVAFDRSLWNAFGLDASLFASKLSLRDSDQVAPFFNGGGHELLDELDDPETSKRTRQDDRRRKFRPAPERLGNVLLVVHITALPSVLPLPTLSKGCLPRENEAIDTALAQGLSNVLRDLQKKHSDLMLTVNELRLVERDCRYIPSTAQAIAMVLNNAIRPVDDAIQGINNWNVPEEQNKRDSQGLLASQIEEKLRSICNNTKKKGRLKQPKELPKDEYRDIESIFDDDAIENEGSAIVLQHDQNSTGFLSSGEGDEDGEDEVDPEIRKLVEETNFTDWIE